MMSHGNSSSAAAAPIMLEIGHDGAVLTRSEIFALRRRRGQCPTCGLTKCYRPFVFFRVPITDLSKGSLAGVCLHCHPERRVLAEFWEMVEGKRWSRAVRWAEDHDEQFEGAAQLCGHVLQRAYKDGATEEFLDRMLERLLREDVSPGGDNPNVGRDRQQLPRCFRHACSYGVTIGHLKRILVSVSSAPVDQTWESLQIRLENGECEWRYHQKEKDRAISLLARGPEYWKAESKRRDAVLRALHVSYPSPARIDFERWYFSSTDYRGESSTNALLVYFLEAHPRYTCDDDNVDDSSRDRCRRQLPLHRAINARIGWEDGLAAIYQTSSYLSATIIDPESGLLPYQLAAIRNDGYGDDDVDGDSNWNGDSGGSGNVLLTECFLLLRNHPEVLAAGGGDNDHTQGRASPMPHAHSWKRLGLHSQSTDRESGRRIGRRQSSAWRLGQRVARKFSLKSRIESKKQT